MIGAFTAAPAPSRRVIVDPGFLSTHDRAALRILYRSDVATTAQLITLAYTRRQTAQEPVGTDAWRQVLGIGGYGDFTEALR